MTKKIFCLVFLSLIMTAAPAQRAKSLLEKCLQKSGEWGSLKSITYTTNTLNHNKWQSFSFEQPTPQKDGATRTFDFVNRSYHLRTFGQYPGGYGYDLVSIGKDTAQVTYDVLKNNYGTALQEGGKGEFDFAWRALYQCFPFFIVRDILQSGDTLRMVNDSTVLRKSNGREEELILLKNGLISSFTRRQNGRSIHLQFRRYATKAGFSYPQTVSFFLNGDLARFDEVISVSFNQPLDKRLLEVPQGYKVLSEGEPMKVNEIAKDVHLIENVGDGRNVMFVNTSDGILVTEAPLSAEVTRAVVDLIHTTIPHKKITQVHLSHFHNDHVGGLAVFVSEGATIVATPATISAVKTLLDENQTKQAKFQSFSGSIALGDAQQDIKLYEIKNSHVNGMSMLYLPKSQILYQSDLFSLPNDKTITPAIAVNRELHRAIKELDLRVKRIVSHHGAANTSLSDLDKSIKLK